MNRCIFTICAKNYIGLALVLEKSIRTFNNECDFYVIVADELDEIHLSDLPGNVLVAKDILKSYITDHKWEEMAFKYNLTEFCTAIKPFSFQYIFSQQGYDKAIYLDPDILTFSSFDSVFDQLDEANIILTPHITTYKQEYAGHRSEKGLMSTGVFNLGFLALKNSGAAMSMLSWWGARLKDQCYMDPLDSYFTDQKWIDFLPCFFGSDDLFVSKNLGLNVAPWNFFERELYFSDGHWMVKPRGDVDTTTHHRLIFVHFSGYNYKGLIDGVLEQNNISNLDSYIDIDHICHVYADFLTKQINTFNKYIDYSYTYATFDDGSKITSFQRRLFRGWIEVGEHVEFPFSTETGTFYQKLKKKGLLNKSSTVGLDSLNKNNMSTASKKLKIVNILTKLVFKLLGLKNYILILRLMRPYSRVENQLHLIDKKYSNLLK
ncbi:glycosyltransferase [Sphingobacterium siyangense]|uniref:glycosyltransferase n=1 Tax=Sphingobacterium siyangense TaxID=459529 RepID=UPI003DA67DCD